VSVGINPEIVDKPQIDPSVKRLVAYDNEHRINIAGRLKLSTEYEELSSCDCVTLCVRTGDEKKLVLGHVESTVNSCCHVMKHGASMIVYSTLQPRPELGLLLSPSTKAPHSWTGGLVEPSPSIRP
jgi:UDP-N-acetyl-D-mannosaminuronate dehydrogenase